MGVGARGRGDLPRVHVLRHGRGDRARGRDTRLRGHRPGHAQPRSRGRRRARHRPDEGDRPRPSLRPAGAARGARRARPSAPRGRRAGVRCARRRDDRRLLDVQLLPDEEPLRARRRRARRLHRRRRRRDGAQAPLPRLARQADLRARRNELPARRDPGGGSPRVPAAPRRLEPRHGARQPRATPSSGSATSSSCRPTTPATCTTCTSCGRPSASGSGRARAKPGSRRAAYYVTPLHLQPAMAYLGYEPGSLPETERAAAENLALPMWGGIAAEQQERVVATVRVRSRRGRLEEVQVRSPVSRHSIWQVGVDAVLVAAAWWLAWSLRFEHRPVYYDRYLDWSIVPLVVAIKLPVFALSGFYNRWWRYVSTRDMWVAFRGVVLASVAVFLVFTLFEVHRVSVPRGVWFIDLLVCMAFVAGIDASSPGRSSSVPCPAASSTRGKEVVVVGAGDAGAARRQGDAAQPRARLHAHRAARRRSAQAQPPAPRRAGARDDGRPRPRHPRPAPGRGADRDPERVGTAPGADRRDRAGARRAGEDAPEPLRPRLRRRRPRPPAAAGRGGGRARARARRGRLRRRSPGT